MSNAKIVEELNEALIASTLMMHRRDVPCTYRALDKYVGKQDMVYEQRLAQYEALPATEQAARAEEFSLSNIFWAHGNPEVSLALTLAQFEQCGDTLPRLRDGYWDDLQNPVTREKITARFPNMTAERMEKAIERVRPLVQAAPVCLPA